jgi:hypothetical protein
MPRLCADAIVMTAADEQALTRLGVRSKVMQSRC